MDSLRPEDAEALQKLVRLVRSADGFALFIVSTASDAYQATVVEALVSATPDMGWRRVHLTPGTEGVLDACLDDSPQPPLPVIVSGFAEVAPHQEAMRRLMTGLNYSRPRWKPNLDVPVVMVVGPEAHQAMLEFAPDFARYRSATVRFLAAPAPTESKGAFMPWLTPEQRRERMRELAARLKESSAYESEAGLYAQVEWSWELSLHRLALGEPPGFEEAVRLASAMKHPRLPVEGRDAVRRLSFSFTGIRDLSSLAVLDALNHLALAYTQVSDFSPLAGLVALKHLNLRGTQVSDLSPLAGLVALKHLNLLGTQVSDLSPLARIGALNHLNLLGTQVSDLSPLAGLGALSHLDLRATPVSDLSPLAGLGALNHLDLAYTQVSDLSPLAGLGALNHLDLAYTQVSDLSPLAGLGALNHLNLVGTPVLDLSPLQALPNLIHVILPDRESWTPAYGPLP